MTLKLTTEANAMLTERWHDQTLDLESLKFIEADREAAFIVLEQEPGAPAHAKAVLRRRSLQQCCVTVKNVTRVQVLDAKGEVELYINEVEASPTSLRLKCVNGTLELVGEGLELSFHTIQSDTTGETEITIATPIGDISWRRRHPKAQ